MTADDDTIVAAATPPGVGGVGVVRLSGADAAAIGARMLGSLPEPRRASLRTFRDAEGREVDRGIAIVFTAPDSFTGEDVIELHAHGGPVLLSMLVDAAVALGARRAQPGEFSKRAFLNDRLDLAQAEAIADLIEAGTAQAARAALRSLSGEFSAAVADLANKLTRVRVYVEAAIDFPEEEIDFLSDAELAGRLDELEAAFDELESRAAVGRRLRDGFRVVLVGAPNAGKSSLMNRLSGEDTAIVTEIAGTTRDILREQIDVDGLLVEIVDTAGLREDPDVIEQEGIRRAREAMRAADAVLWIRDAAGGAPASPPTGLPADVPVIEVANKIDLVTLPPDHGDGVIAISARTGEGVDRLRHAIRETAGMRHVGEGAFTARRRHIEALAGARRHFVTGREALETDRAGELLAEELRLAQRALGAITGEVSADALLGEIFSSFCIGK